MLGGYLWPSYSLRTHLLSDLPHRRCNKVYSYQFFPGHDDNSTICTGSSYPSTPSLSPAVLALDLTVSAATSPLLTPTEPVTCDFDRIPALSLSSAGLHSYSSSESPLVPQLSLTTSNGYLAVPPVRHSTLPNLKSSPPPIRIPLPLPIPRGIFKQHQPSHRQAPRIRCNGRCDPVSEPFPLVVSLVSQLHLPRSKFLYCLGLTRS
jgi:hypothetical protein